MRKHIESHATSIRYDGKVLLSYNTGTVMLFNPVTHIMSYRQFHLFRDDGKVNLGGVCSLPAEMEPFPDEEPLYYVSAVSAAMKDLRRRTLLSTVFPSILANCHQGIGALAELGCSGENLRDSLLDTLLPKRVDSFGTLRLLTRRNKSESVRREQIGHVKQSSLETVNAALAKIVSVATFPGSEKLPYGKKEASIREQYQKWVPHRFVPDKYSVGEDSPRLKAIKEGRYCLSHRERLFSGSTGEPEKRLKKNPL